MRGSCPQPDQADRCACRAKAEPRCALVTLAGILIWLFGILVALAVLLPGVNAGSLLTVIGFSSIAIGFAFKDIFENFLAGILIMMRKKMRIGDHIECQDVEGRVEQITLRETYLRRLDSQLTIVPNAYLFQNPVRIITDSDLRRHEIVVGVAYDTDLDRAAEIIAKAIRDLELVNRAKPIDVFAREFDDSSVNFTVRWWAGSRQSEMHVRYADVRRVVLVSSLLQSLEPALGPPQAHGHCLVGRTDPNLTHAAANAKALPAGIVSYCLVTEVVPLGGLEPTTPSLRRQR